MPPATLLAAGRPPSDSLTVYPRRTIRDPRGRRGPRPARGGEALAHGPRRGRRPAGGRPPRRLPGDRRDPDAPFFGFLFYDSPNTMQLPEGYPEVGSVPTGHPMADRFALYQTSIHYTDTLVGQVLR